MDVNKQHLYRIDPLKVQRKLFLCYQHEPELLKKFTEDHSSNQPASIEEVVNSIRSGRQEGALKLKKQAHIFLMLTPVAWLAGCLLTVYSFFLPPESSLFKVFAVVDGSFSLLALAVLFLHLHEAKIMRYKKALSDIDHLSATLYDFLSHHF